MDLPSDGGRVFTLPHLVGPADVGGDARAHLDGLARWVQDVAFADLLDADPEAPGTWVVRRTRVAISRIPVFRENLELLTFCSGSAASLAERRTSIRGDLGGLVEASATWVHIDPDTRMPARLSARFHEAYGEAAAGRRARGKLRHGPPPRDAEESSWIFVDADLDIAGHVNNTVYWRIAEQYLQPPRDQSFEVEIEHRAEAPAGSARVLRSGNDIWVDDGAGFVHCSIRQL